MANLKISGLTAQTTFLDTNEFPLNDPTDTTMAPSGTDKKITGTDLIAGIKAELTTLPNTRIAFGDASSNITSSASLTFASSTVTTPVLLAKTSVKLEDPGVGTNTVTLQSPTLAGSYTLTLPTVVGTTGQVLTATDNAGTLAFAANAGGDIVGPGSATDNALTRFDGTTGKLVQNSVGILSDAGALSGLTQLDVDNLDLNGNTISSTDTNGNIILLPNGTGITTSTKAIKSEVGLILKQTTAGANTVTVDAPASLSASYTFTLPPDAGTVDYVLTATGGGDTAWSVAGSGDVVGPASSVAGNVPQFADTTGKLIQDSGVTVTSGASGAVGIGGAVTASGVNSVALGATATASILNGLSIGTGSTASTGTSPIAMGVNSRATGDTSIAIGTGARAAGANGVAIGQSAMNTAGGSDDAIAIGALALRDLTNSGTNNVAVGAQAGALLTTGSQNVLMGMFALDSSGVDISDVVVIGYNALGDSTTSAVNGAVAIGSGAGSAVTTGAHNTFVGYNGGTTVATTTGSNNTLLGYGITSAATVSDNTVVGNSASAGAIGGATVVGSSATASSTDSIAIGRTATATTGTANIAIGTSSSSTGTTASIAIGSGAKAAGDRTIAIGDAAMGVAGGSDDSIAIGNFALNALTSGGTNNVAIGGTAGELLTTGDQNVIVGNNSLNAGSVDMTDCTVVGYNAVAGVTTTAANGLTAIGRGALNALTSGAHNTAVGYNGGTTVATTTGSNNTFVGYGITSGATISNNTIVGAAATAATFSGCTLIGALATATANNQFVVNLNNTAAPSTFVSTLVPTIATTASIGTNSFITVVLGGSTFKIALFS